MNKKIDNLFASIDESNKKVETVNEINLTFEQLQTLLTELAKLKDECIQAKKDYMQMRNDFVEAKNALIKAIASINTHIDNLLKNAPSKLKVSVTVSEPDMQRIQTMHDNHLAQVQASHTAHLAEVDKLLQEFSDKTIETVISWGKKVRNTFHNYEGYCATGWVAHVCAFFFLIGLLCTIGLICYGIGKAC